MKYDPFVMERWQSTYEHRVRFNLSESGVHPLSVTELFTLADVGADALDVRLGYGQSNGSDELRNLIASLYPGATDASVLVTAGGAEANFIAFWELIQPEALVSVMLPNYMQVPGLLESFGARVHPFHLAEEDGWQPDLNELENGLREGARFILITNPNNPTGAVLDDTSVSGIVELADRYGAWILADEVYRGAELDGPETPSLWGLHDRVLITNSLSKAYGLPGLRIGWVVGPPEMMEGPVGPQGLHDHRRGEPFGYAGAPGTGACHQTQDSGANAKNSDREFRPVVELDGRSGRPVQLSVSRRRRDLLHALSPINQLH